MIEIITVLILLYQVTMPSLENAKYMFGTVGEKVIRMNTRDGTFEECNEKFECKKPQEE